MQQIATDVSTFSGLIAGRVYALHDSDGLTLVDASISNAGPKILAQLGQMGYKPSDVKRILITHAHPDHVGSLPFLQKETGAEVWCHALEKPVIEGKESIMRRPSGLRPPDTKVPPSPVHRTLADGEMLAILGGLQVVHTPGHAPGHLSFFQPQRRLLIVGDVIFRLFFNRLTLPLAMLTVDMEEDKRSIRKLMALKPEGLLFGHGQPILTNAMAELEAFAQRNNI
jgi:glyoxylase-like metal-dependent hydrolase (beta-lactamase superfamily II)